MLRNLTLDATETQGMWMMLRNLNVIGLAGQLVLAVVALSITLAALAFLLAN